MVRADIVGGLISGMERGYSLKEAMISFYNTGYNKQDIEEAARHVMSSKKIPGSGEGQQVNINKSVSESKSLALEKETARNPKTSQETEAINNLSAQRQSQSYPGEKKAEEEISKGLIITLSIILFVLFIGLISLLIYVF